MKIYKVKKVTEKKNIQVTVPGSKSITNRALMLAALSSGKCVLKGVLFSDDSRAFIECLKKLGFRTEVSEETRTVTVWGCSGRIPKKNTIINVRSAGTTARFLTVLLAVAGGHYLLQASEQMKKRPMEEILDVLEDSGAEINFLEEEGHFPFEINSPGITRGNVRIDTTVSSQYASALLLSAVVNGMKINLTGSRVDGAYIKITLKIMEQFGIKFTRDGNSYTVRTQRYNLDEYNIEPDMSGACYFYAIALLLRTKAKVNNIHLSTMQGDVKFISILEKLGCKITDDEDGLEVDARNVDEFDGIDIDMSDFSDQALTMAVIAAFAKSPTTIRNIGHIRLQESDRAQVIVDEITKIGAKARIEEHDGKTDIIIEPSELKGTAIDTYNDHRVAMSFAMAGLVIDGVVINNPQCCRKTFENYFKILEEITAS